MNKTDLRKMADDIIHLHSVLKNREKIKDRPLFVLARAVKELMQWQPIETAPKDGTWIIGLSKRYGGTEIDRIAWGITRGGYETWCTRDGHYPLASSITHWMLLPPRPDAQP